MKESSRAVLLYSTFISYIVFQLLVFLDFDSCSLKSGYRQASCTHHVPHGRSSSVLSTHNLLVALKDWFLLLLIAWLLVSLVCSVSLGSSLQWCAGSSLFRLSLRIYTSHKCMGCSSLKTLSFLRVPEGFRDTSLAKKENSKFRARYAAHQPQRDPGMHLCCTNLCMAPTCLCVHRHLGMEELDVMAVSQGDIMNVTMSCRKHTPTPSPVFVQFINFSFF